MNLDHVVTMDHAIQRVTWIRPDKDSSQTTKKKSKDLWTAYLTPGMGKKAADVKKDLFKAIADKPKGRLLKDYRPTLPDIWPANVLSHDYWVMKKNRNRDFMKFSIAFAADMVHAAGARSRLLKSCASAAKIRGDIGTFMSQYMKPVAVHPYEKQTGLSGYHFPDGLTLARAPEAEGEMVMAEVVRGHEQMADYRKQNAALKAAVTRLYKLPIAGITHGSTQAHPDIVAVDKLIQKVSDS